MVLVFWLGWVVYVWVCLLVLTCALLRWVFNLTGLFYRLFALILVFVWVDVCFVFCILAVGVRLLFCFFSFYYLVDFSLCCLLVALWLMLLLI